MKFVKINTNFENLFVMKGDFFNDERGLFQRLFCQKSFLKTIYNKKITQVNHSFTTKRGSIRGLHYQDKPHQELKIINCIQGVIFDVVVDLRKKSKTFGKHFSVKLDSSDCKALVIPEGFAHGFQTLTDNVRIIYFHSKEFAPNHQNGVNPFSEDLFIKWPLKVSNISTRDSNLRPFDINNKEYL